MAGATVRVANAGTARNNISGKVAVVIRRRMEAAGRQMVTDATALMSGDFDLNRPFERRRSPGSQRAATALDYTIEGGPELPLRLGWRVKGGDTVVARIIFMNFGTPPHRIYPSGNWPLNGVSGITRTARNFTRGSSQPVLAWTDESGSVVTYEVDHPGQAPAGFLEEALNLAVERMKLG